MTHAVKKGADEGHIADFAFGDEAVLHAEPGHERQHVAIARVIGGKDFRAGHFHVFLANDAHLAAGQREQDLHRPRGVTSCGARLFDEVEKRPRWHDPKRKYEEEIRSIQHLETAL